MASFGDGPGVYKEFLLKRNQVKSYDAFDGAPYADETTDGRVEFLDLTVPVYHLGQFDWVVSLEVAEHISREFEAVYVDNLARHAREGIVLSWAPPGQEGHSHVNVREPEYVDAQMRARGFQRDDVLSNRLKNSASAHWLKRNIKVFLKI